MWKRFLNLLARMCVCRTVKLVRDFGNDFAFTCKFCGKVFTQVWDRYQTLLRPHRYRKAYSHRSGLRKFFTGSYWLLQCAASLSFAPHDVTSLTLVKGKYGITPLHSPMLVLVVLRRALTCASSDGERSVGPVILCCGSNRMYMFATKGKDYFCALLVLIVC